MYYIYPTFRETLLGSSAQGLKSKHQSDIAQNSNELNLNGA